MPGLVIQPWLLSSRRGSLASDRHCGSSCANQTQQTAPQRTSRMWKTPPGRTRKSSRGRQFRDWPSTLRSTTSAGRQLTTTDWTSQSHQRITMTRLTTHTNNIQNKTTTPTSETGGAVSPRPHHNAVARLVLGRLTNVGKGQFSKASHTVAPSSFPLWIFCS
jgi:hypothetical protein